MVRAHNGNHRRVLHLKGAHAVEIPWPGILCLHEGYRRVLLHRRLRGSSCHCGWEVHCDRVMGAEARSSVLAGRPGRGLGMAAVGGHRGLPVPLGEREDALRGG